MTIAFDATRLAPPGSEDLGERRALTRDVQFHGEEELERCPAEALPAGAPALLRALCQSVTAGERERIVRIALAELGFEWMSCATLRRQRGEWQPHTVLTTYAPPAWTRRYYGERHHEIDPRLQQLLRSCLPLVWDEHDLAEAGPPRFVQAMGDSRVRSGVCLRLSIDGAHAAEAFALISLMSSRPDRGWIDDARLGLALNFMLCLHEFQRRHLRLPPCDDDDTPAGALSALQQRILQCLRHGQSDKQIAYGLQLSSHAVDYHMRQLRRRFAVRNRVQLVNAAR